MVRSIPGITTRFQELFRCTGQVGHALLTRSPLSPRQQAARDPVRLACVKHAASVHPEPESNPPQKPSWKSRHNGSQKKKQTSQPPNRGSDTSKNPDPITPAKATRRTSIRKESELAHHKRQPETTGQTTTIRPAKRFRLSSTVHAIEFSNHHAHPHHTPPQQEAGRERQQEKNLHHQPPPPQPHPPTNTTKPHQTSQNTGVSKTNKTSKHTTTQHDNNTKPTTKTIPPAGTQNQPETAIPPTPRDHPLDTRPILHPTSGLAGRRWDGSLMGWLLWSDRRFPRSTPRRFASAVETAPCLLAGTQNH